MYKMPQPIQMSLICSNYKIQPARDYSLGPASQRSFYGVLSHIINPLLTKLVRSRWLNIAWPRSFFACLWTSTLPPSINTQKENLANIQPSRPQTWSITHIYCTTDKTTRKCIFKRSFGWSRYVWRSNEFTE